ncbi:GNAT family N-acetyltransferase [Anaerofilum sp. BX8]|uniref:GNAT family N-acetyltransferase n=1 Tax=Anaerofilum hominis TaxID=2763016 RepID=A0A923IDH9_9FIRM|nr:GNAT family N-acetyltransferase [Anaerofilum hominis]
MICYKSCCAEDIREGLFEGFLRRQNVTKCWRKENGEWTVKDDPFIDDWSESDRRALLVHLRELLAAGGFVCAAFDQGRLKGFASVSPAWFGAGREYLDLTNLHVSEDLRRNGVGRTLFLTAAQWAKRKGAKKLYISAHSAVESQAFYRAMGCREAEVCNQKHVEEEPFDCQLEYLL